jgi:hypothetical protein
LIIRKNRIFTIISSRTGKYSITNFYLQWHLSCLSPYKVPQNIEGRLLQWTALNYFLETQTSPIELCPPSTDPCIYEFPDETETYKIPVQYTDVVKWIMNKNELSIDSGSSLSDLMIGVVQEGVLVAENIGTITQIDGSDQYYCTAAVPCLEEACNYQFVIYDNSYDPPIPCGVYAGSTLQNIIDDSISLSQVINCTLNDFL